MPSQDRGAASVTLDTIIAGALRDRVVFHDEVAEVARAVTDALLAKGHVIGHPGGGQTISIVVSS